MLLAAAIGGNVADAIVVYSYQLESYMRLTSKGQVTIPIEIRERLGLFPNTEVEFEVDGEAVRVRKARQSRRRGRDLIERMRGRSASRLTTDEILALTRG
jgi:AbrB family looped-hinge helix DNA binding protein